MREALAGASLTASQLEGSAGGVNLPAMTAALRAQLGDVDPADLRATEEMLLDLLGGAAGMEGEDETPEEMESRVSALLAAGEGRAVSSLEDLASELSHWDHQADPTMQTVGKMQAA